MDLNRFSIVFIVLAGLLVGGCSTIKLQPSGRPATDQMLSTLSIEDAVNSMSIGKKVKDQRIQLEVMTPGIDVDYLEKVLISWIIRNGGRVVPEDAMPDLVLRILAQSTGSDEEESKVTIPIVLPTLQTGLTTSEITFYRSRVQVARCRLWGYGVSPDGYVKFIQTPVLATHYVANPELLGMSLGKRTDVVELRQRHGTFSLLNSWTRAEPK